MSGADAAAPRALLSDLDGVLVDSTVAVERSWRAFAARHGLDGDAVVEHAHGIPSAVPTPAILVAADRPRRGKPHPDGYSRPPDCSVVDPARASSWRTPRPASARAGPRG